MTAARVFSWPVRVYYQHTDAGAVVYHGRYLDFMEAARAEMLRSLGFDVGELVRRERVAFTVHTLQITYHKPARLGDALTVTTRCVETRKVRLVLDQQVRRDAETLAEARLTLACIDALESRPIAIPDVIREAFEALQEGT
jgi:acyl-CoA thioester hydrolase